MGTDLLSFITRGCDHLVTASAPSLDIIGMRLLLGLATIMLVWFGVQEALASAQGGPGFNMAKFLNFVLLASFAYAFVYFYDSAIPGIGYSLTGFIRQGSSSLADVIGTDAASNMLNSINQTLSQQGPGMVALTQPFLLLVYVITQIMLALLAALVAAIIGYGAIATTIVGLLGPIFIPWMVFEKTEFLFWGWLKAYLSFAFYKVVATAAMSVLGQFYFGYYQQIASGGMDITATIQNFPLMLLLITINIFILLKIPALTASIFSGSTGGHDGGTGLLTALVARS